MKNTLKDSLFWFRFKPALNEYTEDSSTCLSSLLGAAYILYRTSCYGLKTVNF